MSDAPTGPSPDRTGLGPHRGRARVRPRSPEDASGDPARERFDPGLPPHTDDAAVFEWAHAGTSDRPIRLPLLAWDGPLFCHSPLDVPFDVAAVPTTGEPGDRWSRPGEMTAYLGSDAGVAIGELARHMGPAERHARHRIVVLRPRPGALRGLVDLRDDAIDRALGIPGGTTWCFDRRLASDMAALLRADPRHRGLIVPSLAFPDQPSRCNIVLFTDRLDGEFEDQVRTWDEVARVEVG